MLPPEMFHTYRIITWQLVKPSGFCSSLSLILDRVTAEKTRNSEKRLDCRYAAFTYENMFDDFSPICGLHFGKNIAYCIQLVLQNISNNSNVSYKDVIMVILATWNTFPEPVFRTIGRSFTMQLTTRKSQAHDSSSCRNEGLSKIISFVIR